MSMSAAPSRPVFALPGSGAEVTVDLPGERVRAVVIKMAGEDSLVVELTGVPMAKSHNYRKGARFPVRLELSPLGEHVWQAMEDYEFFAWLADERAAKRKSL